MVPSSLSKGKKLKNCKITTTLKYNSKFYNQQFLIILYICIVMYCDEGKLVLTNIENGEMSYTQVPEDLVDLIKNEGYFSIIEDP